MAPLKAPFFGKSLNRNSTLERTLPLSGNTTAIADANRNSWIGSSFGDGNLYLQEGKNGAWCFVRRFSDDIRRHLWSVQDPGRRRIGSDTSPPVPVRRDERPRIAATPIRTAAKGR